MGSRSSRISQFKVGLVYRLSSGLHKTTSFFVVFVLRQSFARLTLIKLTIPLSQLSQYGYGLLWLGTVVDAFPTLALASWCILICTLKNIGSASTPHSLIYTVVYLCAHAWRGNDTEYVWRSEVDFQDLVPLLPPWLPGVELRSSGSGVRPLQSGGGGGVSRDNTIQFPLKN